MDEKRFCRKCLLGDMPEDTYYKSMREYIDMIDSTIKTPVDEYSDRLNECKSCDNLLNGMCRICGCFVEMRAAIKANICPGIEKKW